MHEVQYRETIEDTIAYKEAYVKGIQKIIEDRELESVARRDQYCADIFRYPERYRQEFKAMLGWPLTEKPNPSVPAARIKKLAEEPIGTIYRVSTQVLDGFFMTGLLFQKDERKRPLVIVQHGGAGTPERVGNLYGYTANYHHIVERVLQYDVNVFAPQLLLWDKMYQVEFDREDLDARLKRVGSSVTALEVYGLTRIMDYFEAQEYVDGFGMVGLSYGGFYTLFTAAVDTRIKSAISCSFFNKRKNYARKDWTWFGAAETFSDAEIACLVYPRKLCIEVGISDEVFGIDDAREELCRLREMAGAVEEDWLTTIEFEGTHEFYMEDMPIKKLAEEINGF